MFSTFTLISDARLISQICGHELVGEVIKAGPQVENGIKVGDIVGVGAQSDSCRECEWCQNGNENQCAKQVSLIACSALNLHLTICCRPSLSTRPTTVAKLPANMFPEVVLPSIGEDPRASLSLSPAPSTLRWLVRCFAAE